MDVLRKLAREIHRHSPWRVLGGFAAGSWGVLLLVEYMTKAAGLPGWTPGLAMALLLIGLPVVTVTAIVQRRSSRTAGLFTWRNAILGGVGAGALLMASVMAYLAMWASGIGPLGSLVAQGVLDEGDPLILAELENQIDDPVLGMALTDALRVDLLESEVFTLVDGGLVREILQGMGRTGDEFLTAEVAREVAMREGIKAVVEGEVSRIGEGYHLAVRVVAPNDGRSMAAFEEQAADGGDLLRAVDLLSQRLRERAGESLRDIRVGLPLEAVTTSSLEALLKFAEADRAEEERDVSRAIDLLQESVVLDSTFALAYRKLAIQYSSSGDDAEAMARAAARAYENRDRLTERERHLVEAYYHSNVTGEEEEVARAYRRVLDSYPDDRVALNDLARFHVGREEWDRAAELLERAVNGPGRSRSAFHNLAVSLYNEGRKDEAMAVLDRGEDVYPEVHGLVRDRLVIAWGMGDTETARAVAIGAIEILPAGAPAQIQLRRELGYLHQSQGRLNDSRESLRGALSLAEAQQDPGLMADVARDIAWVDGQEAGSRELGYRAGCSHCDLRDMAASHRRSGEPDSAIVRLEAFVQKDLFEFVGHREQQLGDVLSDLAELYEEVGRTEDARATWLRFAERWQGADESLQPRVRAALAAADRLAGEGAG
jgi:tetratricopeptide (TPR) repeat protein